MRNKQVIRAAVLTYANEVAKNLSLIDYLLENVTLFKHHSSLLESAEDVEVYKEIFGFGKSKPMSVLSADEKAVSKVLKDKIDAGMKKLSTLSKATMEDPTKLGVSLEQMVDIVKDVKEADDVFKKMYSEMDKEGQDALQDVLATVMPAKMALYGLVGFKLTELRKELTSALAKLTSIVPDNLLKVAINKAASGYSPSLPMRSALDVLTGRDLPAGRDRPGMGPMGAPLGLRMGESLEEEAQETPWQEAEPEGK